MNVSVALAAYNGEKYISQQIDSILSQLSLDDELVISLDPSTDQTLNIIQSYNDPRIKVIKGPGKGLIKNFENAIVHTSKEIIFLSDQDDVWKENKIETVLKAFDDNTLLVVHDAIVVDESLKEIHSSFFSICHSKTGIVKNIIKNSYIGCCMAFRKELIEQIIPFPKSLPMHDQYIGLMAEKKGKSKFINEKLIYYRRHDTNASNNKHASILQMLVWRIQIIQAYIRG